MIPLHSPIPNKATPEGVNIWVGLPSMASKSNASKEMAHSVKKSTTFCRKAVFNRLNLRVR